MKYFLFGLLIFKFSICLASWEGDRFNSTLKRLAEELYQTPSVPMEESIYSDQLEPLRYFYNFDEVSQNYKNQLFNSYIPFFWNCSVANKNSTEELFCTLKQTHERYQNVTASIMSKVSQNRASSSRRLVIAPNEPITQSHMVSAFWGFNPLVGSREETINFVDEFIEWLVLRDILSSMLNKAQNYFTGLYSSSELSFIFGLPSVNAGLSSSIFTLKFTKTILGLKCADITVLPFCNLYRVNILESIRSHSKYRNAKRLSSLISNRIKSINEESENTIRTPLENLWFLLSKYKKAREFTKRTLNNWGLEGELEDFVFYLTQGYASYKEELVGFSKSGHHSMSDVAKENLWISSLWVLEVNEAISQIDNIHLEQESSRLSPEILERVRSRFFDRPEFRSFLNLYLDQLNLIMDPLSEYLRANEDVLSSREYYQQRPHESDSEENKFDENLF